MLWKPILFAISAGVLAGCISINVNETPDRPPGGAMTCDAGLYQYLIGQTDTEIDRSHLPKTYRIICADCMATMDYAPSRLNIQLDANKRVSSVRCG